MKKTKVRFKGMFLVILLGLSIQTFSYSNNIKMQNSTNETIGLLVIMKAKHGKEEALKDFLLGGLSIVVQEPRTESWYAFQIDESTFGIFDTFESELGRQEHLKGEVAKALLANANDLLESFDVNVDIQQVNLIASRLIKGSENKGLLVIMKAKKGKSLDLENFLNAGKELVNGEPETVSWYAIKIDSSTYAIFDTFADNVGRDVHLNGQVAAALMQNAPVILEGFEVQDIQMIDVLASK